MGLGMFDTADNSLMVYIFGPEKSRPFTQSIHCLVGVGFVIGTALTKPFLPSSENESNPCPNAEENPILPDLVKRDATVQNEVNYL